MLHLPKTNLRLADTCAPDGYKYNVLKCLSRFARTIQDHSEFRPITIA